MYLSFHACSRSFVWPRLGSTASKLDQNCLKCERIRSSHYSNIRWWVFFCLKNQIMKSGWSRTQNKWIWQEEKVVKSKKLKVILCEIFSWNMKSGAWAGLVDQNHHCFINILQKIVTFRKIDKNLVADTFFLETKIVVFHENVIFFLVRSRSGIFLEFFVLLNTSGGGRRR